TRTDDRVQLIDEEDDILGATNLIHYSLDSLFELATIFCPGYQEREIERDDAFIAQQFRHVAGRGFLSQPFDDGGLPNPCFTEQHWVVFGASAENLNYAFDLVLATDDRSNSPFFASSVRSRPNARKAGVFTSFLSPSCGDSASLSGGAKLGSNSFKISFRVRAGSTSRLFNARAATPSPSRKSPSKMCSVPT